MVRSLADAERMGGSQRDGLAYRSGGSYHSPSDLGNMPTLMSRLEQRGMQAQRQALMSVASSGEGRGGPAQSPPPLHALDASWHSPPRLRDMQPRRSSPLASGYRRAADEQDMVESDGISDAEPLRKRRSGGLHSPTLGQSATADQGSPMSGRPFGRSMPSLRSVSSPLSNGNDRTNASPFRRSTLFDGPPFADETHFTATRTADLSSRQPRRTSFGAASVLSSDSGAASPRGGNAALLRSPPSLSASFVGSYEESLLSGRMSASKSKPLIFDAELGVLGAAPSTSSAVTAGTDGAQPHARAARAMPANLRCPKHINMKFPAHFYNIPSDASGLLDGLPGARRGSEGATLSGASINSPYVGTIDLEAHYINQLIDAHLDSMGLDGDGVPRVGEQTLLSVQGKTSEAVKCGRKTLPAFPGYRVPPKGQIQLIIKNPNLTAVKVFLVPYDLSMMCAGQRTFVRQKCYIQVPQAQGTATPPAVSASPRAGPGQASPGCGRDALRYAVHLQFCSPPADYGMSTKKRQALAEARATGNAEDPPPKIYLHRNIRVVFAARLPDKTEKLNTVTKTLEGPMSPKQSRDAPLPASPAGPPSSPLSYSASPSPRAQPLFAMYSGPGEEWRRALREAKLASKASTRGDRSHEAPLEPAAGTGMSPEPSSEALATHTSVGIPIEAYTDRHLSATGVRGSVLHPESDPISEPNSDPNGERWGEAIGAAFASPQRAAGDGTPPPDPSVNLLLQSRSSNDDVRGLSRDLSRRSRAQTFAEGSSGLSLSRTNTAAAPQGSEAARVDDDSRALLEAWHESLRRRAAPSQSRSGSGRTSPEHARNGSPSISPALRATSPNSSGSGQGHSGRKHRGLTFVYQQRPPSRSDPPSLVRLSSQSNSDEDVPVSDYFGRIAEPSSPGLGLRPQTPTTSHPVMPTVTPLSAMAVMAMSHPSSEGPLPGFAQLTIRPLQAPPR